jgi:hypothetical protein
MEMKTLKTMLGVAVGLAFAQAASAASVLVGNGIEWTWASGDIGATSGSITLNADVSGSEWQDGIGTDVQAYLQAFQLKQADGAPAFSVQSASVAGWNFLSNELSSNGCSGGGPASVMCFEGAEPLTQTDDANFSFTINFVLASGVLPDTLHLKVNWVDTLNPTEASDHIGSHISADVSAVPLPGTLGLLGLGLAGLGAVRRKKAA